MTALSIGTFCPVTLKASISAVALSCVRLVEAAPLMVTQIIFLRSILFSSNAVIAAISTLVESMPPLRPRMTLSVPISFILEEIPLAISLYAVMHSSKSDIISD